MSFSTQTQTSASPFGMNNGNGNGSQVGTPLGGQRSRTGSFAASPGGSPRGSVAGSPRGQQQAAPWDLGEQKSNDQGAVVASPFGASAAASAASPRKRVQVSPFLRSSSMSLDHYKAIADAAYRNDPNRPRTTVYGQMASRQLGDEVTRQEIDIFFGTQGTKTDEDRAEALRQSASKWAWVLSASKKNASHMEIVTAIAKEFNKWYEVVQKPTRNTLEKLARMGGIMEARDDNARARILLDAWRTYSSQQQTSDAPADMNRFWQLMQRFQELSEQFATLKNQYKQSLDQGASDAQLANSANRLEQIKNQVQDIKDNLDSYKFKHIARGTKNNMYASAPRGGTVVNGLEKLRITTLLSAQSAIFTSHSRSFSASKSRGFKDVNCKQFVNAEDYFRNTGLRAKSIADCKRESAAKSEVDRRARAEELRRLAGELERGERSSVSLRSSRGGARAPSQNQSAVAQRRAFLRMQQ